MYGVVGYGSFVLEERNEVRPGRCAGREDEPCSVLGLIRKAPVDPFPFDVEGRGDDPTSRGAVAEKLIIVGQEVNTFARYHANEPRGDMMKPVDKPAGQELPKHFVATALIVRQDRILLVHHRKIGLWLPPGGHIEPQEDPVTAMKREVLEETGLFVEVVPLRKYSPMASDDTVRVLPLPHHVQVERIAEGPHDHVDLVYLCEAGPGEAIGNAESLGIRWFSRDDLNSPEIVPNVRYFALQALDEVATLHSPRSDRSVQGTDGPRKEPFHP